MKEFSVIIVNKLFNKLVNNTITSEECRQGVFNEIDHWTLRLNDLNEMLECAKEQLAWRSAYMIKNYDDLLTMVGEGPFKFTLGKYRTFIVQ